MVRVQTLTTIDSKLKEQAKERGINFSKTLEEALKQKLDPDKLIENLRSEKMKMFEMIREIEREIELLENSVPVVEEEKRIGEGRLDEALSICLESYERNGYLKRSILNFQADKFRVSRSALERAFNEVVGELSSDGQNSLRS